MAFCFHADVLLLFRMDAFGICIAQKSNQMEHPVPKVGETLGKSPEGIPLEKLSSRS